MHEPIAADEPQVASNELCEKLYERALARCLRFAGFVSRRRVVAIGPAAVVALCLLAVACAEDERGPQLRRNPRSSIEATESNVAADAGAPVGASPSAPAAPTPAPGGGPAAPAAVVESFLSDMNDIVVVANGWGPLERNMSNGELDPNDGLPMTIGGKVYQKGLGVHAGSEINVPLNGLYKSFAAEVGVDDEVADNGSVTFQVVVDGEVLFDSGAMTGADNVPKKVDVVLTGKQQMKLLVTNNGDDASDHADWADAKLTR